MEFKRVAVYCGSSTGNDPKFRKGAEALADFFVQHDGEWWWQHRDHGRDGRQND